MSAARQASFGTTNTAKVNSVNRDLADFDGGVLSYSYLRTVKCEEIGEFSGDDHLSLKIDSWVHT